MIITNNEEALRVICSPVLEEETSELVSLLERELKLSEFAGRPGIGLAAPQIGIAKNIAIVRTNHETIDLVNVSIASGKHKTMFRGEGCLSFPGRVEDTMRYQEIILSDKRKIKGLPAIVVQHELDHLHQILLPDRAIKKPKFTLEPNDLCGCGSGKKFKKCCR